MEFQLSLFPETREEMLERELYELKTYVNKLRKSQYAKIGELQKISIQNRHDLDLLISNICKNPVHVYNEQ